MACYVRTDERENMPGSDMQRKKNIRLALLLAVLTLATATVYWYGSRVTTEIVDPGMFRVDDVKAIDQVWLESAAGKVELRYTEPRWTVNGTYTADRNMIDVLMATLLQAVPRHAMAASQADSVGEALKTNAVKVTLRAHGEDLKVFYAGGNAAKTTAWFSLHDGLPYVMAIPGYRVYVSGIFELDASGWRDKYVFGFNWRNFKQLEATFPAQPREDFQVAHDKKYFGIPGITQVDTARLNTFLDGVSLLTVARYETNTALADSLANTQPEIAIKVTDIANREYTLRLYRPGPTQEMVPALVGEAQPAWFTRRQIADLIRPRSFFVGKAQ
jgi:hypothetical protein